jgi:hypothetical protein
MLGGHRRQIEGMGMPFKRFILKSQSKISIEAMVVRKSITLIWHNMLEKENKKLVK